ALRALGEAGESAALPERADAVAAARQDLVRIGLMTDVPDDLVIGRVEHMVERNRELDHAESRAQMPAGLGDGVDRLGAKLVGELLQLGEAQAFQVGWRADAVKDRPLGRNRHGLGPPPVPSIKSSSARSAEGLVAVD